MKDNDKSMVDDDQAKYLSSPISSWYIVLAGPGSGKTTTALRRSIAIDSQLRGSISVDSPRAVLFISFSRASIKAASSSLTESLENLEIEFQAQTVDSLVYEICRYDLQLSAMELQSLTFDERLNLATQAASTLGSTLTDDLCHVFIDEAQDISPLHARFLEAYLSDLPNDCGVTVFADPDQEIYRFLDSDKDQQQESRWLFFRETLDRLGDWNSITFHGDYRSQTPFMRRLNQQLSLVRQQNNRASKKQILDTIQSQLPTSTAERLSERVLKRGENAAVLCRTNIEVLLTYDRLIRSGIQNLNPVFTGSNTPTMPAWITYAWPRIQRQQFSSHELRKILESLPLSPMEKEATKILRLDFPRQMTWKDIHDAYIYGTTTSDKAISNGELTISTIHQSKGLEYDNIGITSPAALLQRTPSESEVLFVALSRARRMTYSIPSPKSAKVLYKLQHNRWYGTSYQGNQRRLNLLTLLPGDLQVPDSLALKTTEILTAAPAGTLIYFEPIDYLEVPTYRCKIAGEIIAETTPGFGETLTRLCGGRSNPRLGPVPLGRTETDFRRLSLGLRPILIPRPFGITFIDS